MHRIFERMVAYQGSILEKRLDAFFEISDQLFISGNALFIVSGKLAGVFNFLHRQGGEPLLRLTA